MTVCRSEVLAELLPGSVRTFQTELDSSCHTQVRRSAEFRAGRACAHAALRGLGVSGAVTRRPDRSPHWPQGTIGSISHCAHLAVAVATTDRALFALGVDVEEDLDITVDLDPLLFTTQERQLVRTTEDPSLAAILVSAKESAFKSWYPTTGTQLEFTDVEITPDIAARGFLAHMLKPSQTGNQPPRVRGRFARHAGHIFTTAWAVGPNS
ncbi:MAG: 4'-phosphopantetheinyl transferase superfamily protein [Ornithinimicrobium sp.]